MFLRFAPTMLLTIALSAQGNSPSSDFPSYAARAEQALEQNRLDQAVLLYRRALQLRPSWKDGWWKLGTTLYDQNQFREAADAFTRLTVLDPQSGTAHLFLGLCQYETGDNPAALDNILAARKLGVINDAQLRRVALYHEAMLELRKSAFETALGTLKHLNTEGGASSQEALLAFGMAILRWRPERLASADPAAQQTVLHVGEAELQFVNGNYEEAKRRMQALIAATPEFPDIHYAFGRLLLDQHEIDSAVAEFEKEIQRDPKHVMARLAIASARYRTDSQAGLPFAEQAVELEPNLPFGHYILGLLLLDTGNAATAIPQLEIARTAFANDAKVYYALGSAYAKVGRREDAALARREFARLQTANSPQPESALYGAAEAPTSPH